MIKYILYSWFELRNNEGEIFGKILLDLVFQPVELDKVVTFSANQIILNNNNPQPTDEVNNTYSTVNFDSRKNSHNAIHEEIIISSSSANEILLKEETVKEQDPIKFEDENLEKTLDTSTAENFPVRLEDMEIKNVKNISEKVSVSSEFIDRFNLKEEKEKMSVSKGSKRSLTKSLFKLSTPEKTIFTQEDKTESENSFSTPNCSEINYGTPVSTSTPAVVSVVEECPTPEIIQIIKPEEVISTITSVAVNNAYTAGKDVNTVDVVTGKQAKEAKSLKDSAFSLFNGLNNAELWNQWTRKTTKMAQELISKALNTKTEKKKNKDYQGVGVGKLFVNIISAEKVI